MTYQDGKPSVAAQGSTAQGGKPQGRTSHRPESVSQLFAKTAIVTGVLFMVLDTFFTIKKGIKVFSTGDFLITFVTALGVSLTCAIIQKTLFSVCVGRRGKVVVEEIWNAGLLGKAAIVLLASVAFAAVHFSFTSTSQGIGVTPQRLGISLPGKEYSASLGILQVMLSAFVGITVAFIDEILFFCAEILKHD